MRAHGLPTVLAGLFLAVLLTLAAAPSAMARDGDGQAAGGLGDFKAAAPESGVKNNFTKDLAGAVGEALFDIAVEGARDIAGDVAELGIKALGRPLVRLVATGCGAVGGRFAGVPGAVLGYAGCHALGSVAIRKFADMVGDWIEGEEDIQRSRFARRENPFPTGRPTGSSPGSLGGGTIKGDVLISVFAAGPVTTTATGSGAKATTNLGIANAGGTSVTVTTGGPVTTRAEGPGEARTDIGVATGEGARVTVNVDGSVTTIATDRAKASTEIGIGSGENAQAHVAIDGTVTTRAEDRGESRARIGVAAGDRSEVVVTSDGTITTLSSGSGKAVNEIGAAHGDGSSATVTLQGDVTARASGRGRAENAVGVAQDGRINVTVDGDVTAIGRSGAATNDIGVGSSGTTHVGGDITTTADSGRNSMTSIGANGSAFVNGDVINEKGRVSVGGAGACEKSRDGRCCLDIYRNRCVTKIMPKSKYGCPPRFIHAKGRCYFIPDYDHFFDN
ncbi:hypothetical protein KAJ83_09015 [Marivibrio halodurans]|uniref:Uncharacterized protein n=1 Tax=Marivibrio halodurans TaxID=2039722 RepID=A0A8J7V3Z7_9PROT|nr:hypothetical protein [Marivibrio halodurans]MBP5857149.1 hypothetical protein [Marivibrio halodurans]